MLNEICEHLHNFFDQKDGCYIDRTADTFTISGGLISPLSSSLIAGQYIRIVGSLLNDGIYLLPSNFTISTLVNETFTGAIFGAETGVTNCMLMLVELPTRDYAKVILTLASGTPGALTEQKIIEGEDVTYFAYPLGVYDSSGTTTAYATFTLTYNGNSVKYEFDLTDITLDT